VREVRRAHDERSQRKARGSADAYSYADDVNLVVVGENLTRAEHGRIVTQVDSILE